MTPDLSQPPQIADDGRGSRCAHNFAPEECPYKGCGYRMALEALKIVRVHAFLRKFQHDETAYRLAGEALAKAGICVCEQFEGCDVCGKYRPRRTMPWENANV